MSRTNRIGGEPMPIPPSTADLERRLVAEMQRGRRVGSLADGERHRAEAAFAAAEQARERAIEAQVREEPDAEESLGDALAAVRAAADQAAEARDRADAGRRVYEQSRARLHQLRETNIHELRASADELTERALQAQDELAPHLRKFVEAYAAAADRWRELLPGTRAVVEQADRERDYSPFRDEDAIKREAMCPPFPVEPKIIDALLTVVARPACMEPDYEPGRRAAESLSEPLAMPVIFPGDPDHQVHGVDTVEQGPVEVIGAVDPPTQAEIEQAQVQAFFNKSAATRPAPAEQSVGG